MYSGIHRPVFHIRARRVLAQIVVTLPVLRWPNRPRHKTTAAVRTDISQNTIHARGAERTFIGADARLQRVGWQRLVAVFAAWSEF